MTHPTWGKPLKHYEKLNRSLKCDVAIIGGGFTGLSAAAILKSDGKKVCVLERGTLAGGDSGSTTAHLTAVTDASLPSLVQDFGEENARLVWEGGMTALNCIERFVNAQEADCKFRRLPGYLHASLSENADLDADIKELKETEKIAKKWGIDVAFESNVPIVDRPGLRFENQAKFHPIKYLQALADYVDGDGSHVFENSEVEEISSSPSRVKANGQTIECDFVVIATHVPLMGKTSLPAATLFQTKITPYTSLVIQAITAKALPDLSLFDLSDPYYYTRIDPQSAKKTCVIFGGCDYKTGQANDGESRFQHLERMLQDLVPGAKVKARWSGQVVETHDGLPYIGETAEKQFAATGFSGNGITFGTLSGLMARDWVNGDHNRWSELFSPSRKTLRKDVLWSFAKENIDYPVCFISDRIFQHVEESVDRVQPLHGAIVKVDGQKVACYRHANGELDMVSATCTHMGCSVHFNSVEQTWDCPCHGSRFSTTGKVIAGPAEKPLEQVQKESTQKAS